jgi:hypothetical protein
MKEWPEATARETSGVGTLMVIDYPHANTYIDEVLLFVEARIAHPSLRISFASDIIIYKLAKILHQSHQRDQQLFFVLPIVISHLSLPH